MAGTLRLEIDRRREKRVQANKDADVNRNITHWRTDRMKWKV